MTRYADSAIWTIFSPIPSLMDRSINGGDHDLATTGRADAGRASARVVRDRRSLRRDLSVTTGPLRRAVPGRRLDRRRRAHDCRQSVTRVRPAGLRREQVRRQRHDRRGRGRQKLARRLQHSGDDRRRGEQSPCLPYQHRSHCQSEPHHPPLASADRARRSPHARRQFDRRAGRAGEAEAGTALCDRKRTGLGAAYGGAMVRRNRRNQARTNSVSRRRHGHQRSARRTRQARLARIDAADPALQGRHAAPSGTNHQGALAEPCPMCRPSKKLESKAS